METINVESRLNVMDQLSSQLILDLYGPSNLNTQVEVASMIIKTISLQSGIDVEET